MSHGPFIAPVNIPATIIAGHAIELRIVVVDRDTRQPEAMTSPFPDFTMTVRRPTGSPETFDVDGTPADQAESPGAVDFVISSENTDVATGLHEAQVFMDDRPLQPGEFTFWVSPAL